MQPKGRCPVIQHVISPNIKDNNLLLRNPPKGFHCREKLDTLKEIKPSRQHETTSRTILTETLTA